MTLLLDTCALIWWTLDTEKLSSAAFAACENMEKNEGFISSISIWELGIKIKNKKLDIGMTIETYVRKINQLGYLKIISIDEEIWLKNLELRWDHRDPADRTIVATAILSDLPLVTSDNVIRRYHENCCW